MQANLLATLIERKGHISTDYSPCEIIDGDESVMHAVLEGA